MEHNTIYVGNVWTIGDIKEGYDYALACDANIGLPLFVCFYDCLLFRLQQSMATQKERRF